MRRMASWMVLGLMVCEVVAWPHEVTAEQASVQHQLPVAPPSAQALEAIQLLKSSDAYQRQLGFLRLEALREPSTVEAIQSYLNSRDTDLRAYSLRAMAAIQGVEAAPLLLERLNRDRHPRVRRAALLGLEPFITSNRDILPACIKALHDRNSGVRITAVDIVSRVNDPRARAAILVRHQRERHRDVRRVLDLAMKRMGFVS